MYVYVCVYPIYGERSAHVEDENGYTPVMAAASWGHQELLELLLRLEPSAVEVRDAEGDTALHHVAQATELEEEQVRPVLTLLLEAKADVNVRSRWFHRRFIQYR